MNPTSSLWHPIAMSQAARFPLTQSEQSVVARYEALIRVSQAVSAYREPRKLFDVLVGELRRVIDFDGIGIAQYDETTQAIEWHVSIHCNEPNPVLKQKCVQKETMTCWVFQNQQALVIPFVDRETRFPDTMEFLKEHKIQSVCMLPLTTVHRRIGSMFIASEHPDAYSDDEVRFLGLVADQMALAIDDALNFETSRTAQDQLKLLLDLTNSVVSTLDLRELLRSVSANLRRVMCSDLVGVGLPDRENNKHLRLYALDFPDSKGFLREDILIPIDGTPPGTAFKTGEHFIGMFRDLCSTMDTPPIAEGLHTGCVLPLTSRGRIHGVLLLGRRDENDFSRDDVKFLMQVASQVAIAVENALAYKKIAELKEKLTQEKLYLEDEIRTELNFEEIVGKSAILRRILKQVATVAPTDSTVLIYGETGTGKELVARAIHNLSSRQTNAFVKLNCAAIPMGLLESELFGHERGAFTGAIAQRIGRFELANRGTVFLDEIGEIPLELQPKLLRVLQEREFERLGSSRTLRTDARLIAATNRDLGVMVEEQKFRADLFYRLNVFPVHVPPLRERQDDIPLLVRHFVQQFARRMSKTVDTIPTETMNVLIRYHWPGNIRELQNLVERAVILSAGPTLKVPLHDLQAQPAPAAARRIETLEEAERRHILDALDASDWVISGPSGAAGSLGLKRSTLQARMEKLGIRRARAAAPSQNSR